MSRESVNPMSPRDKQNYVQVPFSPAYVSAFIQRFQVDQADQANQADALLLKSYSDLYPPIALRPQNYSMELINRILIDEQFAKDYPRTNCVVGGKKLALTYKKAVTEAVHEMKQAVLSQSLTLSDDEIKAFFAFVNSSFPLGSPSQNEELTLQGGVLSACGVFFSEIFLPNLSINLSQKERKRIISHDQDKLLVSTELNQKILYVSSGDNDVNQLEIKSNEDLIIYRDNYSIVKNNDDDNGFTLSVDCDNYEVLIDKNIWAHIIKIAKEKLAVTDFNDVDLFAFIPCLCDRGFLGEFLAKLEEVNSAPQILSNIANYAQKSYGSNPINQQLDQEITLANLCLFLIEADDTYRLKQVKKLWENYSEHLSKLEKASFVTNRSLVIEKKNIVEGIE